MPRPAYRLAIFDFDGTLADTFSSFTRLVNLIADEHGFDRIQEHEIEQLRRADPLTVMKRLRIPAWKLPGIASRMRALLASDAHRVSLFEGASDCLQLLHERRLKISIVSSNAEPTIRRVLGPDLTALVDAFECGASLWGKPAKLRKVVRASGIDGAQAIYIGDEPATPKQPGQPKSLSAPSRGATRPWMPCAPTSRTRSSPISTSSPGS